MVLFPFQAEGDVLSGILAWLPVLAAVILLVGVTTWLLAWMSRYFAYLKTLESRWLDAPTLDLIHRALVTVWIVFVVIITLVIVQIQSAAVRDALQWFLARIGAVFFIIFVIFAATIAVRVFHRFAAYLRGELETKPKKAAPPRALALTEIVLKYLIYTIALIIAVLGAIRLLPPQDQVYIQSFLGTLPALDPATAVALLAAFVTVIVADRFVDSVFEDAKGRTWKLTSRALDELKAVTRYSVWAIGAIVMLFIVLGVLLSAQQLIIFAVAFIAFLIFLALVASDPARNALAGISLIRGDAFDVGDRVRIGDDLVCDVVSMGLATTLVRTPHGEAIILPNARLLRQPILNYSRSKPWGLSLEVAVGFDVAHARVQDLLTQAAGQAEGIVAHPAPAVYAIAIQGDAVLYELLAYTDRPDQIPQTTSALVSRVQEVLTAGGVRPRGSVRQG